MKFSLDDVRTDTHIPVNESDFETVLRIFKRVRDIFATSAMRDHVELIQCRFAQKNRSGPVTMLYKCAIVVPMPSSSIRSEIEFERQMDWQEGGVEATVRLIENNIINHAVRIADSVRQAAKNMQRASA